MKKRFLTIVCLLMVCTCVLEAIPPSYAENSKAVVNGNLLSNEYIEFAVDSGNGRFTVGTTGGNPGLSTDDNKLMLYGHSRPGTSYTTINVNGSPTIYGENGFSEAPHFQGKSNISIAQFGDIKVKQEIGFVKNASTDREDILEIKYVVTNTGSKQASLGLRIMMDTMLGTNDAAPFRLPGVGALTTEREFKGNNIPSYWEAFDSLNNPSVVSYGNFLTGSIKPDKVQFTNWHNVYNKPWDYQVHTGSENGDSAVSIIWERQLNAGKEETYVTRYGLSELVQDLRPPLGVTIAGEGNIVIDNNSYLPYTIVTYIQNVSDAKATDVVCSITLPSEMELKNRNEKTGTTKYNLGSMDPGQEKTIEQVVILRTPPKQKTTLSFSITVTAKNAETKTVTKKLIVEPITQKKAMIIIPGICGSRLFTKNQVYTKDYLQPYISQLMNSPTYYYFPEHHMLWEPETSTTVSTLKKITSEQNVIQSEVMMLLCDEEGNSVIEITGGGKFSPLNYGTQYTYQSLVSTLYQRYKAEYDVNFFSYDWRMSNIETAKILEKYINDNGYTEVTLVCHSMGGLVASEYLSRSKENRDKVNKLITLGTPYLGAPKVVYVFETGNFFSGDGIVDGTVAAATNAFCMATPLKILSPNVQGIYDLLPPKYYMSLNSTYYLSKTIENGWFKSDDTTNYKEYYWTKNLLASRDWAKKANGEIKPMFQNSETFYDHLFSSEYGHITKTVDSYFIIGYDKNTILGVVEKYDDKGNYKGVDIKTTNGGDGTVPFISAKIGGLNPTGKTYYIKEEHGALAKNADVIQLVQNIIDGEANPSAFTKAIQTEQPSITGKNAIKVRLDCPVTLSLLDEQGDVWAYVSESLLYNEDSDKATLYVLGENNGTKMAYLYEQNNDILLTGTGTGVMTYNVSKIENDLETMRAIFLNVPITPNTLIYTNTNLDAGIKLNVDENGDGKIDYILTPDKVLTGTDLETTMENHFHTCDRPAFVWSTDLTSCKAIFTCDLGDAQETVECSVSIEQNDGKTIYTAKAEFMGRVYTDIKTVQDGSTDIPQTGDSTPILLYSIVFMASGFAIAWIIYRKHINSFRKQ